MKTITEENAIFEIIEQRWPNIIATIEQVYGGDNGNEIAGEIIFFKYRHWRSPTIFVSAAEINNSSIVELAQIITKRAMLEYWCSRVDNGTLKV